MRLRDLPHGMKKEGIDPFYISFSDLMVLLCVFFVMMLGVSKIELGAFERIRSEFTGSSKGTLQELAIVLQDIAKENEGVSVRLDEDGVRLDLDSEILFASGSAVLRKDGIDPLAPLIQKIKETSYTIDIEGHTDDKPLRRKGKDGYIETNWSLSGDRASSMVNHLLSMGFDRSRLRIVGYAATRPRVNPVGKVGDELAAARAKNRRVSLLVK